jgi:hypothetical protein
MLLGIAPSTVALAVFVVASCEPGMQVKGLLSVAAVASPRSDGGNVHVSVAAATVDAHGASMNAAMHAIESVIAKLAAG